MKKNSFLFPLVLTIGFIAGMFVGEFYGSFSGSDRSDLRKLNELFSLIRTKYVDKVDSDSIIDQVIPEVLAQLDPHSSYIPASDLEEVNSELEGSFSGIGVQFNIMNDTIMIIDAISGGPAARAGLLPGDRIVMINDSLFVGKRVTNDMVFKNLRGTKGTAVKLHIKRSSAADLLPFTFERGDIPVHSVDVSFMADSQVGYIKISKFGATTYNEFITALAKLNKANAKQFVIDLRRNTGGYMEAAIRMVNEFLPTDRLIVYTEGRTFERSDAVSDGSGSFRSAPMIVLVDEWSASASEIFAGAIQDNDRGLIVGRRTFGKGLVQRQFDLTDGSAIRLTIARYFTPSGRSIQREYKPGDASEYEMDYIERINHGELFSADSMKIDRSKVFQTVAGRTVYGGGGIIPDIFVPHDSIGINSYYNTLYNKGLVNQYCFYYSDRNRAKLRKCTTAESIEAYLKTQNVVEQLIQYAESKGVRRRPFYISESQKLLEHDMIALIARNILDEEAFYKLYLKSDILFETAVKEVKTQGASVAISSPK